MRIHIGCEVTFDLPQTPPVLAALKFDLVRAGLNYQFGTGYVPLK